jgi:cell division protein FtsB
MRIRRLLQRLSLIKLTRKKLWLLGGLLFLYVFVIGRAGLYTQIRLWNDSRKLRQQIIQEVRKQEFLQKEVKDFTDNMSRIELEARQEFGMGAKDEIIVKVR